MYMVWSLSEFLHHRSLYIAAKHSTRPNCQLQHPMYISLYSRNVLTQRCTCIKVLLLHKRITWSLTRTRSTTCPILDTKTFTTFCMFVLIPYSVTVSPNTRTTSRFSTQSTGYCTRTPGLPSTPAATFCKLYNIL